MGRILSFFLAVVMLAGCQGGKAPEPIPEPSYDPIQAQGIVDLFPAQRTAETDAAYAGFSLDLLRSSREEGENTLLSPLSVTLALGMTSSGAAGDTAQEFAQLFGMDKGTLSAYCLALMEDYSDLGGSSQTTLANSLWCDPDLTLEDAFVITCRNYFGAELFHADLQDSATVKAVNGWVDKATHGMIPSVVDRFDEDAVLALVNAIYFKNQFQRPFETPTHAWTMDFRNADGTTSQPQGMSNGTRRERYLAHDGGQGVVLPYDDGKLGLLLMLPEEGTSLADYLAGWDGATIQTLLEGQTEARTSLTVPKFKTVWSGGLEDVLQSLGLAGAFDPDMADFDLMGHTIHGDPLYIGQVIHKTAFELNEKGTEAAAVTAVIMDAATAMPPDDLIVLRFDRPFVYGIVDLDNGAPLFLGTMEHMDG